MEEINDLILKITRDNFIDIKNKISKINLNYNLSSDVSNILEVYEMVFSYEDKIKFYYVHKMKLLMEYLIDARSINNERYLINIFASIKYLINKVAPKGEIKRIEKTIDYYNIYLHKDEDCFNFYKGYLDDIKISDYQIINDISMYLDYIKSKNLVNDDTYLKISDYINNRITLI